MSSLRLVLPALALLLPAMSDEKKTDKIAFEVYAKGYFVKNTAKLDNPAFLVLQDKKAYDQIFGFAAVMGGKPKLVDEKLFEKDLVIVVVKAGNAVTKYEVESVGRDKDRLVVKYTTMDKGPTTARFTSPLIVSVPRGDYTEVVFIENGKEAGKQGVKKP